MRFLPDIIASLCLHILGAITLYVFEGWKPESKPIKVTYITAVQPAAKQKSKMPNRAASVESSKGAKVPEQKVQPKEHHSSKEMTVKKSPPKETSTSKSKKKTTPPKKEKKEKKEKINTPKKGSDTGDKRAALLRELERKKRLNALKGAKERVETSKDGVEDIGSSNAAGPIDAVLGAYIEKCRKAILT